MIRTRIETMGHLTMNSKNDIINNIKQFLSCTIILWKIKKTAEQNLDELQKDPTALEAALKAELGAAEGKEADQKPVAKSEDQTMEGDKKPKTTADRFAEILSDRNEARRKASEAQAEKDALANKVAELEATIATIKKTGEGDETNKKDVATTKALTQEEVMDLVNKKVSEVLSVKEQATLAEKSTVDEINATAEKAEFAGIKGREEELKSVMAKHPTLLPLLTYYWSASKNQMSQMTATLTS